MVTKEFILAGKAIFTVTNASGVRYTFRVKSSEYRGDTFYHLSMLAGPDNEEDFRYIGLVIPGSGDVVLGRKSNLTNESLVVRVAKWSLKLVFSDSEIPEGYKILHAGKCGRCGRMLTVPESIESGIGPECSKKVFC